MIMFSTFLLSGIVLEALAIFNLVKGTWSSVSVLMIHLAASFCVLSAIHQFRRAYHSYNKAIIAMLFLLVFLIPVFGFIASLIISRWLLVAQNSRRTQLIHDVVLSDYIQPLRHQYGVAGLKINLQTKALSLTKRVKALKALSSMPPNKGNNLIRTVLPDKKDELRLLAFNLIDQQEKKIVSAINTALKLLKKLKSDQEKARVYKWIAIQYWELVHCSLIEPDMLDFVLNKAIEYIELAKVELTQDETLWYLLGRIYLRQEKVDLSIEAFSEALMCGAAQNRIIPFLAEAFFYKRNYQETKKLLSSVNILEAGYISSSVINFWSRKHD